MKIIVYHGYYGCDTGCCGHYIELEHNDGRIESKFDFAHPYSDIKEKQIEFAKELVTEKFGEDHVDDLDWDNCWIVDD